ncbi:rod shape-determining protein MreD [Nocardioides jejuensis]|uniref:Rod shape-determining protein MreD n=1 Tax=Nocardioides jejuensis TaxID=2502782 RepID=A0A4R1CIU6_9ACTN|nr:rod shape-determining protein MreD [Nocardioides jejuensis]TCJ30086.1 rod shape-determining protein MreD [Nocardioides jejuensis]
MSLIRGFVAFLILLVAVVLQVTFFPHLAWHGVVPDLALLVVVAAGLTRGPQFAAILGFVGGLLLDLAPPADHYAGRWALALVVVGYVVGRLRVPGQGGRPEPVMVVAAAAAASFLGTSLFALTGLVLKDPVVSVPDMLQVILVALVWDVLLTPLLVPALMVLFRRTEPARVSLA